MANLQEAFAEAVKLNRQITQFLKFSTYTNYDDLSGLDGIDRTDGEQLLLGRSCGSSPTSWRMHRSALPI